MDSEYEGMPIMADKENGLGCKQKILEVIKERFDHAIDDKSKVYFMRYDIRFPKDSPHTDNQKISEFQASFMKALKRKKLKPEYVVVREQSKEKHQHYHGILLLAGDKVQSPHVPIKTAERLWRSTLGLPAGKGLIHDCSTTRTGEPIENGTMLRKDDPEYHEKVKDCFRRASYLAKENQKGNTPKGQREVFSSRTPKKRK